MGTIPEQQPYIHPLQSEWYKPYVKAMDMLRLDVLHPTISGNKWYKLKQNIALAQAGGHGTLLTFGGVWSNHLIATAATAQTYGLKAIGIVRGDDIDTPTLQACRKYGMQLQFISRDAYRQKDDIFFLQDLDIRYNNPYIIPEGGANAAGRAGCGDIAAMVPARYTHVCLSVGTGTTLAGIRNVLPPHVTLYGYVPMKGGAYLHAEIASTLNSTQDANWQLFDQWHNGGFGKWDTAQLDFMTAFRMQHNITLDVVYTAKMMMGIQAQLQSGFFPPGAQVLVIHTGGLQGNAPVTGL